MSFFLSIIIHCLSPLLITILGSSSRPFRHCQGPVHFASALRFWCVLLSMSYPLQSFSSCTFSQVLLIFSFVCISPHPFFFFFQRVASTTSRRPLRMYGFLIPPGAITSQFSGERFYCSSRPIIIAVECIGPVVFLLRATDKSLSKLHPVINKTVHIDAYFISAETRAIRHRSTSILIQRHVA